jgi:putative transposase
MFPDDEVAMKVVGLAVMDASGKWIMPIRNRKSALNRFCIEFGERISACL